MIRSALVLGWLGLLGLAAASGTGYRIAGDEGVREHMVLALFAAALLLFAELCVVVYAPLTAALVRRTAREAGLPATWAGEQWRLALRAGGTALAAGLLLTATFGAGFPTYSGWWDPPVHHALAVVAALAQLAFLLVGGPALSAGERLLAAFGAEVESYTPRLAAAPPAAAAAADPP